MIVHPIFEHQIVIGALNVYVLENASQIPLPGVPDPWIKLTDWAALYNITDRTPQFRRDFWNSVYVHADIHNMLFYNNNGIHLMDFELRYLQKWQESLKRTQNLFCWCQTKIS